MDYLTELRTTIETNYGVKAQHLKTVPVEEVFQGKTIWAGEVEVFAIEGHPKAKRCYAWGYPSEADPGKLAGVTIFEIPPVDSPQTAVKIALGAKAKGLI